MLKKLAHHRRDKDEGVENLKIPRHGTSFLTLSMRGVRPEIGPSLPTSMLSLASASSPQSRLKGRSLRSGDGNWN